MAPLFPDFRKIRKRIRRTLNYGSKNPVTLNFPLSQLMVEYFDEKCPFDYMQPETSTSISSQGFADPCSLIVAIVYLDRLRAQNPNYFESTDPTALYVPALILASKFMHDADTYDRVANSGWAESLDIPADDVNTMEWDFVKNLDWNVNVNNDDFEKYLNEMERLISSSFLKTNHFATYNELSILSSAIPIYQTVKSILEVIGKLTIVYTISIMFLSTSIHNINLAQQSAFEQINNNNTNNDVNNYPIDHQIFDDGNKFWVRYISSENKTICRNQALYEALDLNSFGLPSIPECDKPIINFFEKY